jgi:hypothetical protein
MARRIPPMTRQHFEFVASAIAQAVDYLENEAIWAGENDRKIARQTAWTIAQFLAGELAKTNSQFSYIRFYRACKLVD